MAGTSPAMTAWAGHDGSVFLQKFKTSKIAKANDWQA
jgi:hypothetical protein